jgi:hypothetical protein
MHETIAKRNYIVRGRLPRLSIAIVSIVRCGTQISRGVLALHSCHLGPHKIKNLVHRTGLAFLKTENKKNIKIVVTGTIIRRPIKSKFDKRSASMPW